MIQLNLLPDVKLQFIKAQRQKRLVMTVSIFTTIACVVIFLFLAVTALVWQKKSINDLTKDISASSADLTDTAELDKILTVQNQLSTLPGLHDQKVVSSRLFDVFQQVTPVNASIANLTVDFAANTMVIDGKATDIRTINTFVDGLKATQLTTQSDTTPRAAFSDVVLASFGRAEDATYSITLTFLPEIFSVTETPTLAVGAATGNATGRPAEDLFQENEEEAN